MRTETAKKIATEAATTLLVLIGAISFCVLLIVPRQIWGGEAAASFWGAFIAAIGGFAGVLIAVLMTDRFQRNRDKRLQVQASLAAVRICRIELSSVITRIHLLRRLQIPAHGEQDMVKNTSSDFAPLRTLVEEYLLTPETDKHISVLAGLPNNIAESLLEFVLNRTSFSNLIRNYANLAFQPNAEALSLNWSYADNAILLMLNHAKRCSDQLLKYEDANSSKVA